MLPVNAFPPAIAAAASRTVRSLRWDVWRAWP